MEKEARVYLISLLVFGYVSPQSGTEIISLILFLIELSKNKNKTEYSFKH